MCISKFSNRKIVEKDPLSAAADLFRGSLCRAARQKLFKRMYDLRGKGIVIDVKFMETEDGQR